MQIDLATLNAYMKSGYFNVPKNKNKIDWSYYKIGNNKLIKYIIEYSSSTGWNIFNLGKVKKVYFSKINNVYIWDEDISSNKHNHFLIYSTPITLKPDSSKSVLFQLYDKYENTGKRRNYNDYQDFEKYIDEK